MSKSQDKQKYVIIGIAALSAIIIGTFLISQLFGEEQKITKGTQVVLSENGEASTINLDIPNLNQENDSLSLLEQYQQFKIDSINKSKITGTELGQIQTKKKNSGNSMLGTYASDDNSFLNDIKQQLDKTPKETKSTSKPKRTNTRPRITRRPRENYNNSSSFSFNKKANNTQTSSISNEDEKEWRKRIEDENKDFYNSETANTTFINENSSDNILKSDSEILAVIYRDQRVIDKGRVSMRLAQDCIIDGIKHKRNTVFNGFAKFAPNRIFVTINSINSTPVTLEVYDGQDENKGIYTEVNFKNIAKDELENDAINDINTTKIPMANTIKRLFRKSKQKDKAPLMNEYKLILKKK